MAKNPTILLVIFPGQGHVNPALVFAKRLISEGINVNLATAYSVLNRLSKITTSPPEGLTFTGFSDGYDDGLKLGMDIDQMVNDLKTRGSEAVAKIIKSSIEKGQPLAHVVYTTLIPWVGHVAHALEVPSTLLMVQPATIMDIFYYYFNGYGDVIRNTVNDLDLVIELPGLPRLVSRDLPSFMVAKNPFNFALPSMKDQFDLLNSEKNPRVLVNTFDELEYEPLRAVKKLNLVPIGPLVKDPLDTSFRGDLYEKSHDYIEWLNSKPNGSVVYVSFGSYSELPKKQMEEIAKGFIDSQRPFLWVVRRGKNEMTCLEELEKIGKIVGWCSQVEVLAHPSIGCFVTHCGWNSCLETLVCGVPIVGFPIWIDQGTNAKLMEGLFEVGVRVKGNEDGLVEGDEIRMCLEAVMGEGGVKFRKNAHKWKGLARDADVEGGSSNLNFKNFVKEIKGF